MSPAEIIRAADHRAPGMLSFFAMVGTWIRLGQSRRAYRAMLPVFNHPGFVHAVIEMWPHLERYERETGYTPETWAMVNAIKLDERWQSRDWTGEIVGAMA